MSDASRAHEFVAEPHDMLGRAASEHQLARALRPTRLDEHLACSGVVDDRRELVHREVDVE